MLNLDLAAAEAGQEIVKITSPENKKQANELQAVIVRSLGVLQENGVYALFLYLLAKRDKEKGKKDPANVIVWQLLKAVENNKSGFGLQEQELPPQNREDSAVILDWVRGSRCTGGDGLAGGFSRLLLFRDFFQRVLTYAKYAAEAKEIDLQRSGFGGPQAGGGRP